MTRLVALLCLVVAVAGCGAPPAPSPSIQPSGPTSPAATPGSSPPAALGQVVPAPGSASTVYGPNPGAIVVAIDPGHGGCLDWGVPNPWDNTVANSEKMIVLSIAQALRERLEDAGVTVVMTRDGDEAIAGDDYPPQGCDGPPFRDVNGDGLAGFGPNLPDGTLARDELQARIDLANVARADLLLSIHINSFVDGDGTPIEIAATQTFYTDETAFGPSASARLARDVQAGGVAGLADAPYERQDRGIEAKNYYIVAPPLFETTAERPDPWKQPTRGALMPAVLSEVGSITLEDEATYLRSPGAQAALADGLVGGLAEWFAERPLAVGWQIAGVSTVPAPSPGAGPPLLAPSVAGGATKVTAVNTGTEPWPAGMEVVIRRQIGSEPYLRAAPSLVAQGLELPSLQPGESIAIELQLPEASTERTIVWVDLEAAGEPLSAAGSPPLQLVIEAH